MVAPRIPREAQREVGDLGAIEVGTAGAAGTASTAAADADEAVLLDLLSAWLAGPEAFGAAALATDRWAGVLDVAGLHGVEPLLASAMLGPNAPSPGPAGDGSGGAALAASPLPLDLAAALRDRLAFEHVAATRCRRALDEALVALAASGIPVVALKGPLLAERLYPPSVVRPSSDLDLLFSPRSLERALATLEGLGYRPEPGASVAPSRPWSHHVALTRSGSPPIEAHFRLHSEFGAELPAAQFLARAEPVHTRGGAPALVLDRIDELIYLAVHAAAHRLIRLGWLVDLALLVRASPAIDWDEVGRRCRALEVHSVVTFTLARLAETLRVPIPEASTLPPTSLRRLAATRLCGAWATRSPSIPVVRATSFLHATILCDNTRQSLRSARHLLLRFGARQLESLGMEPTT